MSDPFAGHGLGYGALPPIASPPWIGGLLLAAGTSSRMAGQKDEPNKLLADLRGKPIVRHAAEALAASRARPLFAVTGHQAERVEAALSGLPFTPCRNADFATGLASSLRQGVAALPPTIDGVIVCLGDMPLVNPATIDRLINFFEPTEGRAICVPSHRGQRGNPVLIGRQFFDKIVDLEGDHGARSLFDRYPALVCKLPMSDGSTLQDVDTPAALNALRQDES